MGSTARRRTASGARSAHVSECKQEDGTLVRCCDRASHSHHRADSIAAVVAEPIFGVGMFHLPPDISSAPGADPLAGILWIDDEVMTGFGRTSTSRISTRLV
jgi:adenosylmethionine-8-amino-7-oxononanoate aminotransferase